MTQAGMKERMAAGRSIPAGHPDQVEDSGYGNRADPGPPGPSEAQWAVQQGMAYPA